MPPIITDVGTNYDVKTLSVFKTIGDAFLDVITRKSLFGKCGFNTDSGVTNFKIYNYSFSSLPAAVA